MARRRRDFLKSCVPCSNRRHFRNIVCCARRMITAVLTFVLSTFPVSKHNTVGSLFSLIQSAFGHGKSEFVSHFSSTLQKIIHLSACWLCFSLLRVLLLRVLLLRVLLLRVLLLCILLLRVLLLHVLLLRVLLLSVLLNAREEMTSTDYQPTRWTQRMPELKSLAPVATAPLYRKISVLIGPACISVSKLNLPGRRDCHGGKLLH